MRVGRRLFVAVLPAVLGVLLVAALAYWGQYAHAAPQIVVVTAAAAAIVSLALAWSSARYVARRIADIARKVGGATPSGGRGRDELDELDAIEHVVDRFHAALAEAEARRAAAESAAGARIREHAELMAHLSAGFTRSLDEIRLPLHILLENRFGDLNENQEEMLDAARAAAEAGTADLRRLGEIADVERGALVLRHDRVRLGDLIQSLRPTLEAEGARHAVRLEIEVAPALPTVQGDRGRLQEALALVLADCVVSSAGRTVRISLEAIEGALQLVVNFGAPSAPSAPSVPSVPSVSWAFARCMIEVHGGRVELVPGRVTVTLPVAPPVVSTT